MLEGLVSRPHGLFQSYRQEIAVQAEHSGAQVGAGWLSLFAGFSYHNGNNTASCQEGTERAVSGILCDFKETKRKKK